MAFASEVSFPINTNCQELNVFIYSYEIKYLTKAKKASIVLPVKSDSDITYCLQSYQGLRIDRLLVY